MAYTITRTNGQNPIVIPDGTINTETSVILVGKNYANYGAILDQNFLRLLENSSNTTPPSAPITGELWWDSANRTLKVYTGTAWKNVGSTTSQPNKPTGANNVGDLWWDSANGQLWAYDGNTLDFKLIGPIGGTGGIVSEAITDTNNVNTNVISMTINSSRYAILSPNPLTFTPKNTIPGFATIAPGLNLASTTLVSNNKFVGIAKDSDALGGNFANAYMRSDTSTSTTGTLSVLNNNGLRVGTSNNLQMYVESPNAVIHNTTSLGLMNFRVRNLGGNINAMDIYPNGNIVANFDLTVAGNISFSNTTNDLVITGTSASVNQGTGALRLAIGGLGVAGNINTGGSQNNFVGNVRASNIQANSAINAVTVTASSGFTGAILTNSQPNITSVGALSSLTVSGLISAPGGISGTLITNAQPNITSVGTIANLTVSGTTNLGNVSTVRVSGGSPGQYLITDGNSNLSFTSITGNNNTIAYFFGNVLTGNANLTFNGSSLYVGGAINATGDITAFFTSDARLKKDIEPISNALDKVNSLQGVSFDWNELGVSLFDSEYFVPAREVGVIAQQVKAVVPEVVTERSNGYLAVNYEKLVPVLIEAIKELKAEVDALKSKQ